MLSFVLMTPEELSRRIAERVKTRRLNANLTQQGLAERSGVTAASLKRFERTGQISFLSLLKLAHALGATSELEQLFPDMGKEPRSIKEILAVRPGRRRGRLK
jgi:transcriptional regulator with XRE-family HTH domain